MQQNLWTKISYCIIGRVNLKNPEKVITGANNVLMSLYLLIYCYEEPPFIAVKIILSLSLSEN